ncbi:hypothetical protein A2630_00935 [Candidatus Woesebacteria bacterium RIFCSPHIGHO2_01_FULL_44_10]|uniref:DUF2283 domain-containing protein n=1 Tax=Candidatus Woesebacteria bacterium RIFCSPLOWO2_01_FULL_44_14 TaxID=1802525 RepID=A0A1F8C3H5_9BACT|nr:MAG: hypothetical protein A2630_00935 [Candidatus Woesebacteria bacterium RIFCSPHIGHO2_01_FULL_44_10]OGM54314.1 MAG: hypothetical protein A3F62_00990 [Candidatus Woesebacteria bacterium RIFCSPHIGHO2_12_FULL_44_11]OGM70215.1 MAG: hypothetical protein A2975_04040 [Candidatus Woesebacteria bacterium RIFCSPLOWO2_01_FULL_44_14]
MKIKYDSKIDAIYIKMAPGSYDHTRKVSDSIMVDEDRKNKVLGMEILDARENMPAFNPEKTKFEILTL